MNNCSTLAKHIPDSAIEEVNKEEINKADKDGYTPLMDASKKGHIEKIRWLLEHGADVNIKDNEGKTALDIAQTKGFTEIADLLAKAQTQD